VPSFDVVNCLLNRWDIFFGDVTGASLNDMASLSTGGLAIPSIPLVVPYILVESVLWYHVSKNCPHVFCFCSHVVFLMFVFCRGSSGEMRFGCLRSSHSFISRSISVEQVLC